MAGVRVSRIKHDITKDFLWKYFEDRTRHLGDVHVDKIYYPLMNNDAVITFSDAQASLKELSQQHEMFTVCCLPPEVFTKVQVWVNSSLSARLLAHPAYLDKLRDLEGLEIDKDMPAQEIILKGKMYQVEWAQKHLSDVCDSWYDLPLEKTQIPGETGIDVIGRMGSVQHSSKANTARVTAFPAGERYAIDEGTSEKQHFRKEQRTGERHATDEGPGEKQHFRKEHRTGERHATDEGPGEKQYFRKEHCTGERYATDEGPGEKQYFRKEHRTGERYATDEGPGEKQYFRKEHRTSERYATDEGPGEKQYFRKEHRTGERYATDEGPGEKQYFRKEHHTGDEHVRSVGQVAKVTVSESLGANTPEAETEQHQVIGSSGRMTLQNKNKKQNMSLTRNKTDSTELQHGDSRILHGGEGRLQQHSTDDTVRGFASSAPQGTISWEPDGIGPDHRIDSRRIHDGTEEVSSRRVGESISCLSRLQVHDGEGGNVSHSQQPLLEAEFSPSIVSHETCGSAGGQVGFDALNDDILASDGATALLTTDMAAASSISSDLLYREFSVTRQLTLKIYCEDIVKAQTDVVVSPANSHLSNIGGVARTIARAVGQEMAEDCERILKERGLLRTSQVVSTKAYGRLGHLKYVFHAVGPIASTEEERDVFELSETFFNSLDLAGQLRLRSIAFPFISAGIYGMEIDQCVLALITAVLAYANMSSSSSLEEVHFVHNDINVVSETIILADQQMTREDSHSAKQRFEQGRRIYGQHEACSHCLSHSNYNSRRGDRGKQGTGIFCACDACYSSVPKHNALPSYSAALSYNPILQPSTPSSYSSLPWSAPNFKPDHSGESITKPSRSRDTLSLSTTSYRQRPQRSRSLDRGKGDSSSVVVRRAPSPALQTSSSLPRGVSQSSTQTWTRGETAAAVAKKNGMTDVRPKDTKTKKSPAVKKALSTRSVKKSHFVSLPTRTGKHSNPETQENRASVSSLIRKQPGQNTEKESKCSAASDTSDTDTARMQDTEDTDDLCPVCLLQLQTPKQLECGHTFCMECINMAMKFKPRCPKCQRNYGIQTGNQPRDGQMTHTISPLEHIPGFPRFGCIIIKYDFPSGVQEACHPNPGSWYSGTHRTAYLPNTSEGHDVLQMLKKAFDHRLVFTIGDSRTTGASDVITWNDIHHKTSIDGGPANFGYPDDGYLIRVREELGAKGITSS